MEKSYYIIKTSELNQVDFGVIEETSADTLRLSINKEKTIIHTSPSKTLSFLDNLTFFEGPYDEQEMLIIVNNNIEWIYPIQFIM